MKSFQECDTTNKPGGKGVGRLLWLHVFDFVEIESTYLQGSTWEKRAFPFSIEEIGTTDEKTQPSSVSAIASKTVVRLLNPKSDRVSSLVLQHDELATKLLEHFLVRFAVTRGPSLTVVDQHTGDAVSVSELCQKIIKERHKVDAINMGGLEFSLHHLFVKPALSQRNLIRFCANQRVVNSEDESISDAAPDISPKESITTDGFRYHAYITGSFLDKIIDEDRMRLKFPRQIESDDEQPDSLHVSDLPIDEVTKKELLEAVGPKVREHLEEYLAEIRAAKESTLTEHAAKYHPQLRPFVDLAKKRLDRLKAKPSLRDVEVALYEAKMDGRYELEKIVKEIIGRSDAVSTVKEYRDRLLQRFATAQNQHNQSALTEFVCTRKAVIQVLASFQKKTNGENEFESAIHDLIFPRKNTSDDFPVGPSDDRKPDLDNLWLIDERLVFHKLLRSDMPLHGMGRFRRKESAGDGKLPDITIFDPALTTNEEDHLHSIAIVEFKRPGRTGYTETDNPVRQLIDAAREIREGAIETVDGELVTIGRDVLIFGYGICDLTPQVAKFAGIIDMEKTLDGMGYQKYHKDTHMMMELMTYQKLIGDAERRNAAFFKKLGM